MTHKHNGGPAFPVLDHKIGYHADIRQKEAGISVRDYFAAKAMQGGLANGDVKETAMSRAKLAYEIADAMLAQREK